MEGIKRARKLKLAGWFWRRMAGCDTGIPYVCFPLAGQVPADIFSVPSLRRLLSFLSQVYKYYSPYFDRFCSNTFFHLYQ
jgi:hypothetical protein